MDRTSDADLRPALHRHDPAATRGPDRLAITLIVAVTLIAFRAAANFDFLNWDDEPLLLQNTAYRGVGADQLRWMFTTTLGGHFQPLTWLSFALDYLLWGLWPGGFHLTNVLLHVFSAIVFYRVTCRLLRVHDDSTAYQVDLPAMGKLGGRKEPLPHGRGTVCSAIGLAFAACVAAMVFAVHPLRVESVAWITERRDVLSGVFLLASLALYLRYASTSDPQLRTLLGSLACFVLSLLSKATGMSFPLVLLVLDVYLVRQRRASLGRIALEKVAFAIPAAAAAMFALHAQRESGALWSLAEHPWSVRIAQACYGVWFYVWKTVLPLGLSPLYEQPTDARIFDPGNVLGAFFLIAATGIAWATRRRIPAIPTAWTCYLLLIAPVLGLAQSGPQLVADRYSYLSCVPWAMLLAGGIAMSLRGDATSRHGRKRWGIVAVASALGVTAMVRTTRSQLDIWRNSQTLWTGVLKRTPRTGLAHANLAALYNGQTRYAEAKEHAEQALAILPGNRTGHVARATAALALGDAATAETHFRRAIEIAEHLDETDTVSIHGLAQALARSGRVDEAIGLYRRRTHAEPNDAQWSLAAGTVLAQADRLVEAREWFERAVKTAPESATAWLRLGVVLSRLGDTAGAIEAWEAGLRHSPEDRALLERLERQRTPERDSVLHDPVPRGEAP